MDGGAWFAEDDVDGANLVMSFMVEHQRENAPDIVSRLLRSVRTYRELAHGDRPGASLAAYLRDGGYHPGEGGAASAVLDIGMFPPAQAGSYPFDTAWCLLARMSCLDLMPGLYGAMDARRVTHPEWNDMLRYAYTLIPRAFRTASPVGTGLAGLIPDVRMSLRILTYLVCSSGGEWFIAGEDAMDFSASAWPRIATYARDRDMPPEIAAEDLRDNSIPGAQSPFQPTEPARPAAPVAGKTHAPGTEEDPFDLA